MVAVLDVSVEKIGSITSNNVLLPRYRVARVMHCQVLLGYYSFRMQAFPVSTAF